MAGRTQRSQLWTQGPRVSQGPSVHSELGTSHRAAPPEAAPSAARPCWEGAYLCSPNLESIEAEWLHFKRNYYKPFRECEFQNEISLSKLSLMRRCCAGIGLHPCLQALNGDQILGGAACTGSQCRPFCLPCVCKPQRICLQKTIAFVLGTRLLGFHQHLRLARQGKHTTARLLPKAPSELKPPSQNNSWGLGVSRACHVCSR